MLEQTRQNPGLLRESGHSSSNAGPRSHNPLPKLPTSPNIETQMEALATTFKQYSRQNLKLTQLFQGAKARNSELARNNQQLTNDILFLGEYCQLMQGELDKLALPEPSKDLLSRKHTAEGIFSSYCEAPPLSQVEWESVDDYGLKLQCQRIQAWAQTEGSGDGLNWRRAYEGEKQRVTRLEWQVKELHRVNDGLWLQRQKKKARCVVEGDRQQLFNNVHRLIKEYKTKINALANEKQDIEKKYRHLMDKVWGPNGENREKRLLDQIEKLQDLTQKQQAEIESTIELYQVQLCKIEERRKEEIELYENERRELQMQSFQQEIEMQKVMNVRDDIQIQLMQQQNKNQLMTLNLKDIRGKAKKARERMSISQQPQTVIHISPRPSREESPSSHTNQENIMNLSNLEYQESVEDSQANLIQRIERHGRRRQESSPPPKVNFNYINPNPSPYYLPKPQHRPPPRPSQPHIPHLPTYSHQNRSYELPGHHSYQSVVEYKQKFVRRKPQTDRMSRM